MPKLLPRQIRMTDEQYAELKRVANAVGLEPASTHRLGLEYGLPIVEKKLRKKKKR